MLMDSKLMDSKLSQNRPKGIYEAAKEKRSLRRYRNKQMRTMSIETIERLIKDVRLPGRLVEVQGRLIIINLLDDRSERFMRHELGVSEFCDLILDWRQTLIERSLVASGPKVNLSNALFAAADSVSAPA
jgi:hypothetical protein